MHIQRGNFIGALAIASLLAAGCASLEPVPLQHSNQTVSRPDVKVGESVVVTKTDGAKQKFTVTAVDDDALVGRDVRVPYAQMTALDVQRGGNKHTGLIIGAVVLGALAIAAASSGGGSGGGY
jgi:outer membrane murein-binding lipoprotein Lpp